MAKGMFVQCHGCGFAGSVNLEGGFDAREMAINRMIDEGWRFAGAWDAFVCPACVKAGGSTDALFKRFACKPRIYDKLFTYVELRDRVDQQLAAFKAVEGDDRL